MTENTVHRIGESVLDLEKGTLHRGGSLVMLRPKTFALLSFLAQSRGRVISKDELMDAVWPRTTVSEDSLTQCVRDARKIIGEGPIRTVPGRGYLMEQDSAATSNPPLPHGPEEPGLPLPDRPSIALLPFVVSGSDSDEKWLGDGIAGDIVTGLARFRSLFVIARNSSFRLWEQPVDLAEIGRCLGVSYLLEGSLRRFGNRIRINVQLIEAASGGHLWGERYDRDLTDIFAVQDEVAANIVSTLAGRIEEARFQHSLHKPAPTLAAYEFLLQGLAQFRGYAADSNQRACDFFEKAIAADPTYARAYACLALARLALNGYRATRSTLTQEACQIARRAVDLDPLDGSCHRALGHSLLYHRDYDTAEHHARRSTELNSNDADAAMSLGYLLVQRGRPAEGLAWMETAMRLNPFYPPWYNAQLAAALYNLHRFDEATKMIKRIPDTKTWAFRLAASYGQLEQSEEAQAVADAMMRDDPGFTVDAFLGEMLLERHQDIDLLREGLLKAGLR